MSTTAIHELTIVELRKSLIHRTISSLELTQHFLDRIEQFDPALNAYRVVCPETALDAARAADARLSAGDELGPLHGIPFAAKDLMDVAGLPTTAGTSLRSDHRATDNATVIQRLFDAGMLLLGKTNTVQFAYGGVGINHDHGTPHNPWSEVPHIPGGSSSGSGVAVSARLSPMALGSDTGGSVRLPAGLCGITGLKTTVGQVSLDGVYPLSWTLDSIGPLVRSAEDAAYVYQAIQGWDPADGGTAGRSSHDVVSGLTKGVQGMKVALPDGRFHEEVDDDVAASVHEAARVLQGLGADLVGLDMPEAAESCELAVARSVIGAEAWSSNRDCYDRHAGELDPVVSSRLSLGKDINIDEYFAAVKKMLELRNRVGRRLAEIDVMLVPTAAVCAAPVAEVDANLDSYMAYNVRILRNTTIGNVLNLSGLTVPCGFNQAGLPIGLMIYAPPFCEDRVLRVGHAYQQATDWHRRSPVLDWV